MNLSDIETWYLNLQMQIHLYETLNKFGILKDSWSGSEIIEGRWKKLMVNNELVNLI